MVRRFSLGRLATTLMVMLAGFAAGVTGVAAQSDYPNKPVQLVTPFAPGGAGDGSARVFAQHLGEKLGQQVVVINRAGGNTIPAVLSVVKAKPDGYTLLWDGPATSSIQMSAKDLPYDVLDRYFGPRVNVSPYYLAVPANSPYKTLGDLVQALKSKPRDIKVAWLGGLSMTDTVLLSFLNIIDVKLGDVKLVPFTGSGPAATALAGGHIDLALGAIPAIVPLYKAGTVRILALAGDTRLDVFPDVPSSKEAGYLIPLVGWNALGGPKGIPDDVANKIDAAVKAITDDPKFSKDLDGFSYVPQYMTPEENRAAILREGEVLGRVRAEAGVN